MLSGIKKRLEILINLGSTYHHIGNCYTELGRITEALDVYKRAIESFERLGRAQYLSNSMAEIGEILVKVGADAEAEVFLSEDLLIAGLDDSRAEVKLLLASKYVDRTPRNYFNGWNTQVSRKVFALVKLASLTNKIEVLGEWARRFEDEVLEPSFGEDDAYDDYVEEQERLGYALYLITTIAAYLGQLPSKSSPLTREDVINLSYYCYLFGEWGWDIYQPFEWLAALLRRRKFHSAVEAWQLRVAIENHIWTGAPFMIPGEE